jgi:hypothetical protein
MRQYIENLDPNRVCQDLEEFAQLIRLISVYGWLRTVIAAVGACST